MMRTVLGVVAALCLLVMAAVMFRLGDSAIRMFTGNDPMRDDPNTIMLLLAVPGTVLSAWALAWVEKEMKRGRAGGLE